MTPRCVTARFAPANRGDLLRDWQGVKTHKHGASCIPLGYNLFGVRFHYTEL